MSTISDPVPVAVPVAVAVERPLQPRDFKVHNAPDVDNPEIVAAAPKDQPTDSHQLANAAPEPEEIGAVQLNHGQTEVKDLGWNDPPPDLPLVGGLQNDELWTLIRRFNKVTEAILGQYLTN